MISSTQKENEIILERARGFASKETQLDVQFDMHEHLLVKMTPTKRYIQTIKSPIRMSHYNLFGCNYDR